jgi:hypothetical protein
MQWEGGRAQRKVEGVEDPLSDEKETARTGRGLQGAELQRNDGPAAIGQRRRVVANAAQRGRGAGQRDLANLLGLDRGRSCVSPVGHRDQALQDRFCSPVRFDPPPVPGRELRLLCPHILLSRCVSSCILDFFCLLCFLASTQSLKLAAASLLDVGFPWGRG